MKSIPTVALALVALVVAGLRPAAAQSQPADAIDEARKNARIKLGGLYLSPSAFLKELGWDTNVFHQGGDEPRSDFIITVTPRVEAAVPIVRRALISGTAAADVMYFAQYASERAINPELGVRTELYLNRITPFAEVRHLNTRQRYSLEIDARVRYVENAYAAGVGVRLTPKTAIGLSHRQSRTNFDEGSTYLGEPLDTALNGTSRTSAVSLRHTLSPLTAASLAYERQEDRFPQSPIRDTDSFRVVPGIEFKPRALISGSAHVGYRRFEPLDRQLPAQAGLVSRLALSYTLHDATVLGVSFDRDYEFSYSNETPYFTDNGVRVFVRRALVGRFDVIVDAARNRYDYERRVTSPEDASKPPRRERTDQIGANLGYRFNRETRIGFGVSRVQREADQAVRGYDGFRYVLTMSTSLTK